MADEAVADLIHALETQVSDAQAASALAPARIRVTRWAPEGSMLDVPYFENGHDTGRREVLIHPEDWKQVLAMAREQGSSRIIECFGIPVTVEED